MAEVIRTDTANAHGEITRLVINHGPEDGLDSHGVILSVPPGLMSHEGPEPNTIGKDVGVLATPPGLMSHEGLSTPIKP